jgi:transposase
MFDNNNPDTLKLFTNLLALPDITVTKISKSSDNRNITFVVESTCEIIPCRQCAKPTRGYGHGRSLCLRHLSLLGKETYIEITPRRVVVNTAVVTLRLQKNVIGMRLIVK